MQDRPIVKGERSEGGLPEEGSPYWASLSPSALSCHIGVLPPERTRALQFRLALGTLSDP